MTAGMWKIKIWDLKIWIQKFFFTQSEVKAPA